MKSQSIVVFMLMVLLAVLLQLFPVYTNESYVYITALSSIPIAILSTKPMKGIIAAILTFLLISVFDTHESIFFLLTNALIGLNLGICYSLLKGRKVTSLIGGTALTVGVIILMSLFELTPLGPEISQLSSSILLEFLVFAILYTYIYNLIFRFIFVKIEKYIS